MPMDFFFSYSRVDNDPYLLRFLEDLSKEVRQLRSGIQGEEESFFDQYKLRLGEDWKEELFGALQTTRTIVCACSPNYFSSEYCGKEWQVMHLRRESYLEARKLEGQKDAKLPPLIKPVIWVPFEKSLNDLPEDVTNIQYKKGLLDLPFNNVGVLQVVRNGRRGGYWNFIRELATEIVEDSIQYPAGPLDKDKKITDIPSAFKRSTTVPSSGITIINQSPNPMPGPNHVRFVYVAAKPSEVRQHGRTKVESYTSNGGGEWQPFYPPSQGYIASLAHNVATGKGLHFIVSDLSPETDLHKLIEAAESQYNLVVLLVDSWTAGIAKYQEILRTVDKHKYFNCSVLILWNENDSETAANRELLDQYLKKAFPHSHNSKPKSSIDYSWPLTSEKEFRKKLQKILLQLRDKVREGVQLKNPIQGGGGIPLVNGTGNGGAK